MTNIFLYLLPLSIKACVVVPLILVIRLALKKQPKIYSYVLWLVVFAGLVFNIKVPIAHYNPISNLTTAVNSQYVDILDNYVNDVHIYHDNRLEYYTAVENGITPVYNGEDDTRYVVVSEMGTQPDTIATSTMPKLALAWAIGVQAGLYTILKSYINSKYNIQIVEKNGDICYTNGINTPFVYGMFKPMVCIPAEMKENLSQSVIEHERNHIRRGDHIVKPLCLIISVLHWYNPLVWLAFSLMCKDMEMSCDEAVISRSGDKKEYSMQLLNCAVEKQPLHTAAVLFGESYAESRIKNILSYKQPAKIISLMLISLVAVLSTACMVQEKVDEVLPSPIPPTFYEQLADLNSTADVQYKERELIESAQGIRNTGIFRADEMSVKTVMPPEVTPASVGKYVEGYNGLTGTTTQTKDGPFSSFAYVLKNSEKLHICYADETEYAQNTVEMPQGHKLLCVATGLEMLSENLEFLSYYTEDINGNLWLNIHKITDGETSVYQHKMDKENGVILRGLRFINESVGFMGQTERGKFDIPQASITIDGGKTWQQLDFSALTAPQYFTSYRSCCMVVLDNMIEIRYFADLSQSAKDKLQNISDLSTSSENYSIISEDGGLTWTGYLRVRKTLPTIEYTHQKVTDTVPVRILTQ